VTFGSDPNDAAGDSPRRLRYFNAGFLKQPRVRRILSLTGTPLSLGKPTDGDGVAVWGRSPYAARGEAVAAATGAPLIRIEDAFLRSLHPGREGEPPLGLVLDRRGIYFDAETPSDLEHLLRHHPLDDTVLMDRARGGIARLREARLSKYAAHDRDAPAPEPGYVLVIDQTRGDASVTHGGADANTFKEMLYWAQEDHPAARIVIKTHPETQAGHRPGYFSDADVTDRITLVTQTVDPWTLMEGAVAVYVVTSQMGFDAILAGHRPVVFGRPFFAGWGLTDDRHPIQFPAARRGRNLSKAQIFACAMILYPTWYHPCEDRLCPFEEALSWFEARARAWHEDRHGWQASGMRLWKRPAIARFFGQEAGVRFSDAPATPPRRAMVWASAAPAESTAVRVEDGFLRSRGLGAQLVPPLSLACDDLGIYYDPSRESRLERLIAARANLRPDQTLRAEQLVRQLIALGLTKYNLADASDRVPPLAPSQPGPPKPGPATPPAAPSGDTSAPQTFTLPPRAPGQLRILVPGQVEDDASIRLGAGEIDTNRALLQAARDAHPDAQILYKPHPDVVAGLRPGALPEARALADAILDTADTGALLTQVDALWTMTSLMGFEALLRNIPVTTTGTPFYAGWGLTTDLGRVPLRRQARPSLLGLAHAALIDYPRYYDPVSRQICSVETAVARLSTPSTRHHPRPLRLLSKAQGLLASVPWLWR
jgi:capsular polysaccharide export protein